MTALDVSQNEVDMFISTLREKGTPWGDGCASLVNKLWTEVQERRIEVEKYKAWAASCDPTPPAPLTSNLDLAERLRVMARGYSTESGRDALLSAARIVEQVETPAPQAFMYCPGAGLLRCEHRDCIDNGCHLVRDGSCSRRIVSAEILVRARELNTELRRAVKTGEES